MRNKKTTFMLSLCLLLLASLIAAPTAHAQEGSDWSAPINLSLSGLAADPNLLIDFQGNVHVFWLDDASGYKYSRSTDKGATWSTPVPASLPFYEKGPLPLLLSDPTGAIHIFWIDADANLMYGQTTPANLANSDQWQSNRRLASNVLAYDVILDKRNALQLTYIHNASGLANPAGIFYMRTAPGGAGWSNAKNLYVSEYFRSTKFNEAFLRIAASNTEPVQSIYVTWDNRSQKRVFMAASADGGSTWGEAQQVKGPQDTGGLGSPFNLNVAASGQNVLLVWQLGEPGSGKCTLSSQWSEDAGATWGEVTALPGGTTDCPEVTRFINPAAEDFVLQMTGQSDPILLAWDGSYWSDPQTQTRLPSITNPLTFDAILLGCRVDLIHEDRLYVAGCDESGGGDAWFLSRAIAPVEAWFAPLEAWSAPVQLAGDSAVITGQVSTPDPRGVVHSLWGQSATANDGSPINSIQYARWDGKTWSKPEAVIGGLDSAPAQLAVAVHDPDKLYAAWVDGTRGEMLFSWVNLERANLASEWAPMVGLPSPSNLIASPDMVVDASGRIVLVYAVPLNEERGIYVIQSADSGQTWSSPVRVFDAVTARLDRVDEPEIILDGNGRLHVIFRSLSARSEKSLGLLYSRSLDGGVTWSLPQVLSEGDVRWSELIGHGPDAVHALWQEFDGLVFANLSQLSRDGGVAWSRPYSITGVNNDETPVAASADSTGTIHFVQLLKAGESLSVKQDDLTLQDWVWDGTSWSFASDRNLSIRGRGLNYDVDAAVTSAGLLVASISAQYSDLENQVQNDVMTFSRYLGESATSPEAPDVLIPTPVIIATASMEPAVQPTQSVDMEVLYDDNVPTSATRRNMVGLIIIGVVLVGSALLLIRGRPRAARK